MNIRLLRYSDDGDSTLGLLFINGAFFAYTLEDEFRAEKIAGETRIPEGTYNIDWKEAITPLTSRYRRRYDWFDKHLEIKNVDNFSNIYIHIGNTDADTDGCILIGTGTYFNGESRIIESTSRFKSLYKLIKGALDRNDSVSIDIVDITKPFKVSII